MYLFIHRYDGPDTGPSKASQWPRPKQVENTVAELLFRFCTRLSVAAYQVTRIQVNYGAEEQEPSDRKRHQERAEFLQTFTIILFYLSYLL